MKKIPSTVKFRIRETKRQELKHLFLNFFFLENLPEEVFKLEQLKHLFLRGNQLHSVLDSIASLKNLRTLDLCNNNLTEFPRTITNLPNLEVLDLSQNQIREIPPEIAELKKLKALRILDNPIEIPPPEVTFVDRYGYADIEKINSFYRQLDEAGEDYLYEAKLLIVGEAGAGKTSLAKKIVEPRYRLLGEEPTTEGIEVSQWHFSMEDDRQFRVNIWDFGGQEIYHATHQFFLTKRSLYTLVADTRKEDTPFFYWLNVVELSSNNSPLLIIKNEKQDRHREINESLLRGRFSNLRETLTTNLKTGRGLSQIQHTIKHYIVNLPHVGAVLPKTWVNVRKALESDSRSYISLEEYLRICKENGFTRRKDALELSDYLHDFGVCLHFRDDPLLRKIVILKPEWGTDAVYKVLDNETVRRNLGMFTLADLTLIWNDEKYVTMFHELLQLMMNFKLCYQLPGSQDTYIAPQLLTENQPTYVWPEKDNLIVKYTYDFMPKGIITRFIVSVHNMMTSQQLVWKYGIVLRKGSAGAEVIEDQEKREVTIKVAGLID